MSKKTAQSTASSPSSSVTVALSDPLARPSGDGTVEELTLRAPMGGDLRGIRIARIAEMDTDELLKLVPRIATPAVTAGQLNQLSARDTLSLFNAVLGFFTPSEASPTT